MSISLRKFDVWAVLFLKCSHLNNFRGSDGSEVIKILYNPNFKQNVPFAGVDFTQRPKFCGFGVRVRSSDL